MRCGGLFAVALCACGSAALLGACRGAPTPTPGGQPAAPPPRAAPAAGLAWRLDAEQLRNTVAVLFDARGTATPAPVTVVWPFEGGAVGRFGTGAAAEIDDGEVPGLLAATAEIASAFAARVEEEGACGAGADCLRRLVGERGPLLLQRPLAEEEVDVYVRRGLAAAAGGGARRGGRLPIAAARPAGPLPGGVSAGGCLGARRRARLPAH